MRFFFHLFGTLFYIIWTVIGAAILVGAFLLISAKPWQAISGLVSGVSGGGLSSLGSLGGLGSIMGQTGNISDVVQKMSSGKSISEGFSALPKTQQDCLSKELGGKTINDALAGKLQPTPDLIFKAMKCIK